MKFLYIIILILFCSLIVPAQTGVITKVEVIEDEEVAVLSYSFDEPLPAGSTLRVTLMNETEDDYRFPLSAYDTEGEKGEGKIRWYYSKDSQSPPADENYFLITAEDEEIPWYYYVGGGVVAGAAAFLLFSGDDAGGSDSDNGGGDGGNNIGTPPVRPIK